MTNKKTITFRSGEDIRTIRDELNLKQVVIAEEAGVTQALISQMENDRLPISIEVAHAIHVLSAGKYPWPIWWPLKCCTDDTIICQCGCDETTDYSLAKAYQLHQNIRETESTFV